MNDASHLPGFTTAELLRSGFAGPTRAAAELERVAAIRENTEALRRQTEAVERHTEAVERNTAALRELTARFNAAAPEGAAAPGGGFVS